MNERDLHDRIILGRISGEAGLSAAERDSVAGDAGLRTDVEVNAQLHLPDVPAPPQRAAVLAAAYARAEDAGPNGSHARRQRVARWYLRPALVAAACLVAVAALLLTGVRPAGEALRPGLQAGRSAWAATPGYIVEYVLGSTGVDEYGNSSFPTDLLRQAVADWMAASGIGETGSDGRPTVVVNADYIPSRTPLPTLNVRVDFVLADEDLLDGMVALIAEATGFDSPEITPRDFYYSEKYPGFCSPQRSVTIDGTEYTFPDDFTDREIETLVNFFLKGWHIRYSGHAGFGIDRRFGDCDVYRFERLPGGNLVFSVAAQQVDIEKDAWDLLRTSSIEFVPTPGDLNYPWRDPVLELIREAQDLNHLLEVGSVEVPRYHITWTLVPDELWAPVEKRRNRMKRDLFDRLRTHSEEEEAYLEDWLEKFQADVDSGRLNAGEIDIQAIAEIRTLCRFFSREEHRLRISDDYKSVAEIPEADRLRAEELFEELTWLTAQWYRENAAGFYIGHPHNCITRTEPRSMFLRHYRVTITTDDKAYLDDLLAFLVAGTGSDDYEITETGKSWRILDNEL